jgi:HK97 gp10 family phage protein
MRVYVKVTGAKEAAAALQQLPKELHGNAMGDVLYEAAKPIADEARRIVRVRTGTLRDSIKIALATKDQKAERGSAIFIGATEFYAHFMEFGAPQHPPYPFMRPAFDAKGKEAQQIIEQGLLQAVSRAVAVAAGKSKR